MNRTLQLLGLTVEQVRNHPGLKMPRHQEAIINRDELMADRRKSVKALIAAGMTQTDIAIHLNCARSLVSRYANGR